MFIFKLIPMTNIIKLYKIKQKILIWNKPNRSEPEPNLIWIHFT